MLAKLQAKWSAMGKHNLAVMVPQLLNVGAVKEITDESGQLKYQLNIPGSSVSETTEELGTSGTTEQKKLIEKLNSHLWKAFSQPNLSPAEEKTILSMLEEAVDEPQTKDSILSEWGISENELMALHDLGVLQSEKGPDDTEGPFTVPPLIPWLTEPTKEEAPQTISQETVSEFVKGFAEEEYPSPMGLQMLKAFEGTKNEGVTYEQLLQKGIVKFPGVAHGMGAVNNMVDSGVLVQDPDPDPKTGEWVYKLNLPAGGVVAKPELDLKALAEYYTEASDLTSWEKGVLNELGGGPKTENDLSSLLEGEVSLKVTLSNAIEELENLGYISQKPNGQYELVPKEIEKKEETTYGGKTKSQILEKLNEKVKAIGYQHPSLSVKLDEVFALLASASIYGVSYETLWKTLSPGSQWVGDKLLHLLDGIGVLKNVGDEFIPVYVFTTVDQPGDKPSTKAPTEEVEPIHEKAVDLDPKVQDILESMPTNVSTPMTNLLDSVAKKPGIGSGELYKLIGDGKMTTSGFGLIVDSAIFKGILTEDTSGDEPTYTL
ncbi:MAG TPA: hypothetical protein VJ044_07710, partial [Candidatus Hodarchaeales archaeon]|nr:hypothetical protein [Candidatus Hodarchaeales archaeon]